jgi:hypothetical protein
MKILWSLGKTYMVFFVGFFLKEIQLFYMYFKCWATNSCFHLTLIAKKRISGVMVGVDRGFEPRSGQTKDHNIFICLSC